MSARVWIGVTGIAITLAAFIAFRSRGPANVESGLDASVTTAVPLVIEPKALMAVERRGLALTDVLPARAYSALVEVLEADLRELGRRPDIGGEDAINHSFDIRWLRDADAKFELVGLVPRLDRGFAEPNTCGELRRIYRLALTRPGRPTTRLPMTLSVISFLPATECRAVAKELLEGHLNRYSSRAQRVEVNLQNLHGTATPQDNEDHAEYLLRSFDIAGDGALTVHPLLATPREDLTPAERERLSNYLRAHTDDVEQGTLVLPSELLATRAISASPRGLARERNRVFGKLFGADAETRFAGVHPSPRAFLRRLDQGTCQGCHQSRAVAGFHLLGEERDGERAFNALRMGISNHLASELQWRAAMIEAVAAGRSYNAKRPFAEDGGGTYGARCGLGDPGFAEFKCVPGLECKDDRGDELGACLPADGPHEGDACEPAVVTPRTGPNGDHLSPLSSTTCRIGDHVIVRDGCLGNGLGFPGGMCTDRCTEIGATTGDGICALLPMAGYEAVCFRTNEPIEKCLASRASPALVRACDETRACRDDYACARVTPRGPGACVPPYFVFQARVDGPRADR